MQNLILLWTALSNFFDLMPLEASKGKTISKIWISRLEVPNWQYRETISGRTKPPSFLDPSGQSFVIYIVLIILAFIPIHPRVTIYTNPTTPTVPAPLLVINYQGCNRKMANFGKVTDPNWVGSFGSARYTWRYVATLVIIKHKYCAS